MKKNEAAMALGKLGGLATKRRLGRAHYSAIGKLGRNKQLNRNHESISKPVSKD